MKKKTLLIAAFISALLVITNAQITNVAIANFTPYTVFLPKIVIQRNGSIVPETEFINHTGNVYTLTGDISNYSLVIERSNIILDGKGHTINGSQPSPYMTYGTGLSLDHVVNATVKDLEITGFYESIRLKNTLRFSIVRVKTLSIDLENSDVTTITESTIGRAYMRDSEHNILTKNIIGQLSLSSSHNNKVTENNITRISVHMCDSNKYYANNFLSADNSFLYYLSNKESFWDNGSIGNYWSDYLTRFPNASEIGSSGIGNIPYEINQVNTVWKYGELVNVTWMSGYIIDHYPLMYPWGTPEVTVFSLENATYAGSFALNFSVSKPTHRMSYSLDGGDNVTINGNMTLNGLDIGFHSLTVYATDIYGTSGVSETVTFTIAEPFPVVPVAATSIATVAVVGVGLLVYFKKRKR